jgi:hypothetical protein
VPLLVRTLFEELLPAKRDGISALPVEEQDKLDGDAGECAG